MPKIAILLLIITGLIATIFLAAYLLRNLFQSSAVELSADSYLLVRRNHRPIGFKCARECNKFMSEARDKGMIFDIYTFTNGDLAYVGSSRDLMVS